MANMSYCRFENTLRDLRDCADAMDDKDLSEREASAREGLLVLAGQLVADYEDEIEEIHERRDRQRLTR